MDELTADTIDLVLQLCDLMGDHETPDAMNACREALHHKATQMKEKYSVNEDKETQSKLANAGKKYEKHKPGATYEPESENDV